MRGSRIRTLVRTFMMLCCLGSVLLVQGCRTVVVLQGEGFEPGLLDREQALRDSLACLQTTIGALAILITAIAIVLAIWTFRMSKQVAVDAAKQYFDSSGAEIISERLSEPIKQFQQQSADVIKQFGRTAEKSRRGGTING